MKYLLVLLVVAVAVWALIGRSRGGVRGGDASPRVPPTPKHMARCAHCGVHLPANEALIDGASVYCSEDHRRLGPGSKSGG